MIVTYKDRKWFLGVDKEFEFFLPKGKSFEAAYALLKDKLDRRLVAAVAPGSKRSLTAAALPGVPLRKDSLDWPILA